MNGISRSDVPQTHQVGTHEIPGEGPHPLVPVLDISDVSQGETLVIAVGTSKDCQPLPAHLVDHPYDMRNMGLTRPTYFFANFVRVWHPTFAVPITGTVSLSTRRALKHIVYEAAKAHLRGQRKISMLPTDDDASDATVQHVVKSTCPAPALPPSLTEIAAAARSKCPHGSDRTTCLDCSQHPTS
jgi:hypothetical protein